MRRLASLLVPLFMALARPAAAQDTTVSTSWHGSMSQNVMLRILFHDRCTHVAIVNRGTTLQDVYLRIDNDTTAVDPAIGADPAFVVAGNTMRIFPTQVANPETTRIRLISSAATKVSAECRPD